MRIKKKSIDEIFEKVSIIELISSYTELKKSGSRDYSGLCPFHNEDTPSFYVNPDKKVFYCFGCKKSGNLVQFIQQKEMMSFVEALEFIANKFGIPLDFDGKFSGEENKIKPYLKTMSEIIEEYKLAFSKNKQAKDYMKKRKISSQILKDFKVGYSEGNVVITKKDQKKEMIELGIASEKGSRLSETMTGRIIFPINDRYGRPIAMGGRALDKNIKNKYLNSRNNILYDKSKNLFGIFNARNHITEKDFVIITEGFFDCMRLHEKGFRNSVAILGTSFTNNHIKELLRLTKNFILLFDGDKSGKKAMFEACLKAPQFNINLRIVELPDGQDPDDFLKDHPIQDFVNLLRKSKFYVDFYLAPFMKEDKDIYVKSRNAKKATDFLMKIGDPVIFNEYKKQLENHFNIKISRQVEKKVKEEKKKNKKITNINNTSHKIAKINDFSRRILLMALKNKEALDIIFRKYYKIIEDVNLKNIIFYLHMGKNVAELLELDIPAPYKDIITREDAFSKEDTYKELESVKQEVDNIFISIERNRLEEEKKSLQRQLDEISENLTQDKEDEYIFLANRIKEINIELEKKVK